MSFHTLISGRTAATLAAVGLVFTASACDSNEPDPGGGDEELITQVVLRFTNAANAADVQTITAADADGDGAGLVFSPASVRLTPGATYTSAIELNDTINTESISDEVAEEAEDHLFRYAFTPASAGTVTVTDLESQYGTNTGTDLPVGLAFRVAVASGASGAATFNATLFHFDGGAIKSSATATSDERDIDIDFPVTFGGPAFAGTVGQ